VRTYREALKVVPQGSGVPDCGVASLSTLLGVGYERTLAAVIKANRYIYQNGISSARLMQAAKSLGRPLTALNPSEYDLEEAVGILEVVGDNHFVILARGSILDLRGPQLWLEPDVFFSHYRARPGKLLVEE
jgi:ABC-type bacteriocin/lantibiotic exporter with double-glycine peptidase domain